MSLPARNILILRFSSLGDIIMTTAMIRCVRRRYPQAHITMVVREEFLDLISHNPHIDEKIGLSRHSGIKGLWNLFWQLRRTRFDLIYDAHRSLRTRFLMPFLRAKKKAYFPKHYLRRSLALTFKLPLLKHTPRFLEQFVTPLRPYGVLYDGDGPELIVPPDAKSRALQKVPLPPDIQTWVGLIPSAQWPGKRWAPEQFRRTLQMLVETRPWGFLIFGGRTDGFCHDICRGFPTSRVINAQGKLDLAESSAYVRHCQFVIANDTGLMHVADALGVPQVLIFGPTSRELGCLPFHPLSEIVEKKLWCRPCSKNGQAVCIRRKRWCLERISPQEVVTAALRLGDKLSQ